MTWVYGNGDYGVWCKGSKVRAFEDSKIQRFEDSKIRRIGHKLKGDQEARFEGSSPRVFEPLSMRFRRCGNKLKGAKGVVG